MAATNGDTSTLSLTDVVANFNAAYALLLRNALEHLWGKIFTWRNPPLLSKEGVGRYPKVLNRVSRILINEGLHFANLFYIFEWKLTLTDLRLIYI